MTCGMKQAEIATNKIRLENQKLEGKLDQLKRLERSCQKHKEILLKEENEIEKNPELTNYDVTCDEKIYNQIYPLVEEICHQQNLLKELQQQLQLASARKEKYDILTPIAAVSSWIPPPSNGDASLPVCVKWYQEMMTNTLSTDSKIHNGSFQQLNQLYFGAEMKTIRLKTSSEKVHQLSFSTCYHGICALITIQQAHTMGENESEYFIIRSDPFIEHLQEKGFEAIQCNQSISTFITDTIWTAIQNSALMS